MLDRKLPWENLERDYYDLIQEKERKQYVTYWAWTICIACLVLGFLPSYRMAWVIGVVLLITLLTKKYASVTEKGLELFYDMKLIKNHQVFSWDKIDSVAYKKDSEDPKRTVFYFTMGDRTKKAYFKECEKKDIMQFIHRQGKKIKLYDGDLQEKIKF